ncbi:MAG TPA: DUF418 domain-containing protein [Fimbriimonadaceae bacterium]|nr:DUF418 domain-containing protein [Fimbriimonadaceae bacterium]
MGRLAGLDSARGVAILGILLANIPSFSGPAIGEAFGALQRSHGAEAVLEGITLAFVTGKCRGLLALLFGVGIAMQFANAMSWPARYPRRCLVLAVIGLLHGLLIWFGDILLPYALTALIVSMMISWPTHRVLKVIKWMFGACVVIGLLISLPSAEASSGGEGAKILQREISAFSTGSYLEQVGLRVAMLPLTFMIAALLQLHLIPVFLAGVLLYRSGIVTNPQSNPTLTSKVLKWSFGLGIPLNLLGLLTIPSGTANSVAGLWEIGFAPILAVGLLIGLQVIAHSNQMRSLIAALANVGRFALTNYIAQSILCTTLFYGLRLFNKTSPTFDLVVVVCVWIVNLGLGWLLARRGRTGPLERALRA